MSQDDDAAFWEWKAAVIAAATAKEIDLAYKGSDGFVMLWNDLLTVEEAVLFHHAGKFSMYNRQRLQDAAKCGCYFCLRIYRPEKIVEWTDGEATAMCPYCFTDTVVPDCAEMPVTPEFLEKVHKLRFASVL